MPTDATLTRYVHQWGATAVPFTGDHPKAYQEHYPQVQQAHQHLTQSAALRSLMLLSGPNGIGKSHLLGHWRDQPTPASTSPSPSPKPASATPDSSATSHAS